VEENANRPLGVMTMRFADGGVLFVYTTSALLTEAKRQMSYGRIIERVEQGGQLLMTGDYLMQQIRAMSSGPRYAPDWLRRN
jgi:hypothetical protein